MNAVLCSFLLRLERWKIIFSHKKGNLKGQKYIYRCSADEKVDRKCKKKWSSVSTYPHRLCHGCRRIRWLLLQKWKNWKRELDSIQFDSIEHVLITEMCPRRKLSGQCAFNRLAVRHELKLISNWCFSSRQSLLPLPPERVHSILNDWHCLAYLDLDHTWSRECSPECLHLSRNRFLVDTCDRRCCGTTCTFATHLQREKESRH